MPQTLRRKIAPLQRSALVELVNAESGLIAEICRPQTGSGQRASPLSDVAAEVPEAFELVEALAIGGEKLRHFQLRPAGGRVAEPGEKFLAPGSASNGNRGTFWKIGARRHAGEAKTAPALGGIRGAQLRNLGLAAADQQNPLRRHTGCDQRFGNRQERRSAQPRTFVDHHELRAVVSLDPSQLLPIQSEFAVIGMAAGPDRGAFGGAPALF